MCFFETESWIATEFSQRIWHTMGKKLMELVLIDFPLVPPLGFVVPSLFERFHFLSTHLMHEQTYTLINWERFDQDGQKPSDLKKVDQHPGAFRFIRETSVRTSNEFN